MEEWRVEVVVGFGPSRSDPSCLQLRVLDVPSPANGTALAEGAEVEREGRAGGPSRR